MRHLTPDDIQRCAEAHAASTAGGGAAAHLASCARCHGEVEALRAVFARLDGLRRHGPATGFADGVARRIDLRGAALDHQLARLPGWSPAPGFATAVLSRVRLPVPWPERLLRFVGRRRTALAAASTATLAVSGGGAAWLFGTQGFGPGQLLTLAAAGARALLLDVALAAGRLAYRLGLVDAGGSILDRINPTVALTSLALSSVAGIASLWVMATLFRRSSGQLVRLRRAAGGGLVAALLVGFPAALPAQAQEVEIADAAITLSAGGRAELWFRMEGGTEHRLRFESAIIELDGEVIGAYGDDGPLVAEWRDVLREYAGEDAADVREGLLGFRGRLEALEDGTDGESARTLGVRLDDLLALDPETGGEEAGEAEAGPPGWSLQIVPGGLGFDVAGRLDRLREALRRLGDTGESFDADLAMIVHGDYRIAAERAVPGDVAILDGTLRLHGAVEGDVLMLDGALVFGDGARVEGDVFQVGGDLDIETGAAAVRGEILSDIALAPATPAERAPPAATRAPTAEAEEVVAPPRQRSGGRGPWSRLARNVANATEGLVDVTATFIGLAAAGLVLVYFARRRLETIADTVRREFARSLAMGVAGQILFIPACLVLLVLVITWPVLPFFVLAVGLAGLGGYLAVAHGAGEMFARRRTGMQWLEALRRSNSYYYVVSGLALLLLPFAAGAVLWVFGGAADLVRGLLMFAAGLGTWVLFTAGFGGVLLTRGGDRSVVVDWSGAVESDVGARDVSESPASGADAAPDEGTESAPAPDV